MLSIGLGLTALRTLNGGGQDGAPVLPPYVLPPPPTAPRVERQSDGTTRVQVLAAWIPTLTRHPNGIVEVT